MTCSYLDDGIITRPPADHAANLRLLEERGPALGLQLNMDICEVWGKEPDLYTAYIPSRVVWVAGGGVELLGSSVGESVCPQNRWPARRRPRSRPSLSALTACTGVRGDSLP
jgi:hypothetical protein